ncbi:MAG: hypothetical protein FJ137_23550, partial [Deltaproteobacteria bacterium]|nr:hypothetical protein [Deltaproteobacteria bacterium]
MRPLHSCPLLVLAFALLAPNLAHADLVVPAEANCRGKKVGDACNGGTCQSDGFECQAGACRR